MEEYKDKKDYMNGFLEAKEQFPDEVDHSAVIGYIAINVRIVDAYQEPLFY
jgi:hypothetical protein